MERFQRNTKQWVQARRLVAALHRSLLLPPFCVVYFWGHGQYRCTFLFWGVCPSSASHVSSPNKGEWWRHICLPALSPCKARSSKSNTKPTVPQLSPRPTGKNHFEACGKFYSTSLNTSKSTTRPKEPQQLNAGNLGYFLENAMKTWYNSEHV